MATVRVSYNFPTRVSKAVDDLASRRNQEKGYVVATAVLLDQFIQSELDNGSIFLIQRPNKQDPEKLDIRQLDMVHVM